MIKEILLCIIGTFGFAVIMKAPKKSLAFIIIGGAISAGIYAITDKYIGNFLSCLSAMICIVFYSEIIARVIKVPSTVIILPSAIPLLPGSAIYYSLLYAVSSDLNGFLTYAKKTLYAGLGIALGAVIGSTVINLIYAYKR